MKSAKAVLGAAIAGAGALGVGLDDGSLSAEEVAVALGAIGASFGLVWAIPNTVLVYAKAIAGGTAAGGAALLASLDDGAINGNEWYAALIAVIGAVSVFFKTNTPTEERPA